MTELTRALPRLRDLTGDQFRGYACVWCGTWLDDVTAVDLGPTPFRELGQIRHWYPRACGEC